MLRRLVLILALSAAAPARAEPARAHLPPVNGVAFGTAFAAAQAALGPRFKAADGPDGVRTLTGRGAIEGLPFDLAFVFTRQGKLSEVRAQAVMPSEEFAACHDRWDQTLGGLISRVGRPDRREESVGARAQFATAGFDFADGGTIEALLAGCYLRLTFERAPVRLS